MTTTSKLILGLMGMAMGGASDPFLSPVKPVFEPKGNVSSEEVAERAARRAELAAKNRKRRRKQHCRKHK